MKRIVSNRPCYILIVEDDEGIRLNLTIYLEDEGFKVDAAGTAEEALELVKTKLFDVGIVDYHLPGINGLQFIQQARRIEPDMRFIVCTTLIEAALFRKLLQLGVKPGQIVTKPLKDMALIVQAINTLILKFTVFDHSAPVSLIVCEPGSV